MEKATNPSPSSVEDEKNNVEIARLEAEIDALTNEYFEGRKALCDIDDSDIILQKIRSNRRSIEFLQACNHRRAQNRFLNRITIFPEEILLNDADLDFWMMCDTVKNFYDIYAGSGEGFTKSAILLGIKEWIGHRENWTNEMLADLRREAQKKLAEDACSPEEVV